MKKRILALLLCGILSLSVLTACGDSSSDAPDTDQEVENTDEENTDTTEDNEAEVIDGFVYAGQDLADASRPVYNNDMSDNYSGEEADETGRKS